MTDAERYLAYAESQASHPNTQLRPLLATVFGPGLLRLHAVAEEERVRKESLTPVAPSKDGQAPAPGPHFPSGADIPGSLANTW